MFFGTINYINCILVFESYLAAFLLCAIYEKKSGFIWKGILLSLAAMTIGYFFPFFTFDGIFLNILYWVMMYSFLLILTFPSILLCYHIDVRSALSITFASYMVHHMANLLEGNVMDILMLYAGVEQGSNLYVLLNCLTYFITLGIVYGLFFFVYFKQKKDPIQASFHSMQIILFSFGVVLTTIVISILVRFYPWFGSTYVLYMVSMWQNLISCVILSLLFYTILRHNHMESELEVETRLLEEKKKQYELSKENIESLNIKLHDLKYRMQMLADNNEQVSRDDLKDITKGIGIYDSLAKTGNTPLDIVLTEYALRCENNHISFTSVADGKSLEFMTQYDIYTLFGNAITNAIEAVMKLKEADKRQISLVIKKKNNVLLIILENYFDEKPIKKDSEHHVISSKADKLSHGYGTRSMALIVERYGGTIQSEIHDDIYTLTIAFYTNGE